VCGRCLTMEGARPPRASIVSASVRRGVAFRIIEHADISNGLGIVCSCTLYWPRRPGVRGGSTRAGATAGIVFWPDLAIDRIPVWRLEIANVAPLRGFRDRLTHGQRFFQRAPKNQLNCIYPIDAFVATVSASHFKTPLLHHSILHPFTPYGKH